MSIQVNIDQNDPIVTQNILDDLDEIIDKEIPPPEIYVPAEEFPSTSKIKPKIKILQNILLNPSKQTEQDSTDIETVHTSIENPILNIPFTEKNINTYKNQIIISSNKTNQTKHTYEKVFDKNRHYWQIPENINENQCVNLIK